MFGWHDRLSWKSPELKGRWAQSWPDLVDPSLSAYGTSDPDADPYATSDNPIEEDPYGMLPESDNSEPGESEIPSPS